MAWKNEAALPFTITANLHFSPILTEAGDSVVYLMDEGTNFYKYNLDTHIYTQLTAPNNSAANCSSQVTVSPDGLKLTTLTDRQGEAGNNSAHRVEVYTIATDTWVASALTPSFGGERGRVNSLAWEDNDILWVWARELSGTNTVKCLKYVISTDTWTAFANSLSAPTITNVFGAAIKADKSVVYGGHIGAAVDYYAKYTIATDTYGTTEVDARLFQSVYDRDKLWYTRNSNGRQGYVDTADDSQNDDKFTENTDRDQIGFFGVKDDGTQIIAYALTSSPFVMSLSSAEVTTESLTAIANTTATGNGTIVDTGLSAVTAHGHVVDTTVDPKTTADGGSPVVEVDNGAGSLGVFTSSLTGLLLGQKYFARAYIINTEGTVYGANVSWLSGQSGTQLTAGNLAVVQNRLHWVGHDDGKERFVEGTLV